MLSLSLWVRCSCLEIQMDVVGSLVELEPVGGAVFLYGDLEGVQVLVVSLSEGLVVPGQGLSPVVL